VYFDAEADGVVSIFDIVCSLSYLGPSRDGQRDVVLTAAHCLPPPEENLPPEHVVVSFDNNNDDQVPDRPIAVLEWAYMTGFGHDRGDLRDLGVFLLPAGSVRSAFPAAADHAVKLPAGALLDQLKRDQHLKFLRVDAIGYGAIPIWNQPGGLRLDYDGIRRVGSLTVTGLTKSYVRYNQNAQGVGSGSGVCFGDSGSPNLFADTDVIISVTGGGNPNCNSDNYNTRVDTTAARDFLSRFVELD
jgi:hypothetical protein